MNPRKNQSDSNSNLSSDTEGVTICNFRGGRAKCWLKRGVNVDSVSIIDPR